MRKKREGERGRKPNHKKTEEEKERNHEWEGEGELEPPPQIDR